MLEGICIYRVWKPETWAHAKINFSISLILLEFPRVSMWVHARENLVDFGLMLKKNYLNLPRPLGILREQVCGSTYPDFPRKTTKTNKLP